MPSKFIPGAEGNTEYMETVKAAYAANNSEILNLIDEVERLTPGDGWRHIRWPWVLS